MKLSRWKPKLEKKCSIQLVKGSFQIVYYCLYINFLAQFNNPTAIWRPSNRHRPAAVLLLLTWQQLTVWQLNGWRILGSVMEPLYCVTAWDYCKGKTEQQHIKQFNIHTQHLPTVRRAFFRPKLGVQNGRQEQHRIYIGISWAVRSLCGAFSANRIAVIGWLFGEMIDSTGGLWLEEL